MTKQTNDTILVHLEYIKKSIDEIKDQQKDFLKKLDDHDTEITTLKTNQSNQNRTQTVISIVLSSIAAFFGAKQ